MWSGVNDTITSQSPRNYMYGDKVFILDELTTENTAFLIGDLTNFVLNDQNRGTALSFLINSPGGEVNVMMSIIGLMNLAKLYDIEISTFVFGLAGSAASMIAINGDIRYMSNISRHFIHFGCIFDMTTKHSEIEKMYIQNKEYANNLKNLYLVNSKNKLPLKTLEALQDDERGYLNAEDCLKYGLCDYIIENQLEEKENYSLQLQKFEESLFTQKNSKVSSKKTSNKVSKKKQDKK